MILKCPYRSCHTPSIRGLQAKRKFSSGPLLIENEKVHEFEHSHVHLVKSVKHAEQSDGRAVSQHAGNYMMNVDDNHRIHMLIHFFLSRKLTQVDVVLSSDHVLKVLSESSREIPHKKKNP